METTARGASGSGEASAADVRKQLKKKNRGRRGVVAGPETWTGEKKTKKIQGAPISEPEVVISPIEGFDWDWDKLMEKIDSYKDMFENDPQRNLPANDDEVLWQLNDEQQLTKLNERLALYRIRACEISKGTPPEDLEVEDTNLIEMYPPSILEDNGYFDWYEGCFEWYFDPEYCDYANLQDYQRLILRNHGQFEEWECYRKACSTFEGDQQFVQFWERLLNETKCIKRYLTTFKDDKTGLSQPPKMGLAMYLTMRIAADYPKIMKTLIFAACSEFMWSAWFDNTIYKECADFYFEIWKLVAKQKIDLRSALKRLSRNVLYSKHCSDISLATCNYETYVANIDFDEKVPEEEVRLLIMEAVKQFKQFDLKLKIYYDYAKKKLGIAEEIGLITPNPKKK